MFLFSSSAYFTLLLLRSFVKKMSIFVYFCVVYRKKKPFLFNILEALARIQNKQTQN